MGVLLIVRPGTEGFSGASLWILACVFFCVVRDLATKRVPDDVPSLAISSLTAAAVTAIGGAMIVPLGGWRAIEPGHLGFITIAAVLLLVGYQFIIMAMRSGEISFVAPFRYTALVWALFLGWVVFSVIPDNATLAGSAIVVASGLYMLWRERKRDNPIVAESTGPAMAPDGL